METPRLLFREWRLDDDLDLAWQLFGDLQVTKLVGGPFSKAQVADRIHREMASLTLLGVQYWPIFLKDSREFVGCCGLKSRPIPQDGQFEMGFYILSKFHGKGLATEASRAVIHHSFTVLKASALFAGHHPMNHSSRNVLLKLGFEDCGMEFYPPTGLDHPLYCLSADHHHSL